MVIESNVIQSLAAGGVSTNDVYHLIYSRGIYPHTSIMAWVHPAEMRLRSIGTTSASEKHSMEAHLLVALAYRFYRKAVRLIVQDITFFKPDLLPVPWSLELPLVPEKRIFYWSIYQQWSDAGFQPAMDTAWVLSSGDGYLSRQKHIDSRCTRSSLRTN